MFRLPVPAAVLALSLALPAMADGISWADAAAEDAPPVDADMALAMAQDAMVSVFYHELGHALIDILEPPVLGLEEDAADVLSVLLINELWDEASSEAKLRATAGFWAANLAASAEGEEMPLNYGVHSPDDRRYFTYVCLWYGASPDTREAVAIDLGLPEERAVTCPDEFDLANRSWGPYLDATYEAGAGTSLVWTGPAPDEDPFAAVLKDEVDYLNTVLSLPRKLTVAYGACDMANAFYDPSVTGITMCSELAEWAYHLALAP